MEIKPAVRRALPLQIAFFGPSGSGKTFSALLFAAGLAGPGGKVVVIDTERGRASLYADNPKITAVLPNGYSVLELDPPYHPNRFMQAIDMVEKGGFAVCIIDSLSDAWDGPGGCTDIAEKDNGKWNGAKLVNKKMMMRIVNSDMSTICLFKAQEKTKIIDKKKSESGKQEFVELGMMPVSEKSNFYPMLLGFSVDPKTHLSTNVKFNDALYEYFKEPRLIGYKDGEKVRQWNQTGAAIAGDEQLKQRSRAAAEEGTERYVAFFTALTPAEKKALIDTCHADNKRVAAQVDTAGLTARFNELSDSFGFRAALGALGYEAVEEIPADKRASVLADLERELAPVTNPV